MWYLDAGRIADVHRTNYWHRHVEYVEVGARAHLALDHSTRPVVRSAKTRTPNPGQIRREPRRRGALAGPPGGHR